MHEIVKYWKLLGYPSGICSETIPVWPTCANLSTIFNRLDNLLANTLWKSFEARCLAHMTATHRISHGSECVSRPSATRSSSFPCQSSQLRHPCIAEAPPQRDHSTIQSKNRSLHIIICFLSSNLQQLPFQNTGV